MTTPHSNLFNTTLLPSRVSTHSTRYSRLCPMCIFLMSIFISGILISGCTVPNPSFKPCTQTDEGCIEDEVCNGEDDDQDGTIDEGLASPCAILSSHFYEGDGPENNFGRALVSLGDLNGDGVEELLVGAARPSEEIIGRPPREGMVYLIDGESGELLWSKKKGGDFGFTLSTGDFNGDGILEWVGGAPSQETQAGTGRIMFFDQDGEMITEVNSSSDGGLALWLSTSSRKDKDWLLISEPTRDGEEGNKIGRIRAVTLSEENEHIFELDIRGSADGQRLGERVISITDVTDDGVVDLLSTGWRERGDTKMIERQVWALDGVTGERFKRFSASEDTDGSFGEAMTIGRVSAGKEMQFIFSSPRVRTTSSGGDEMGKESGRIYFITSQGESRGVETLGRDGLQYGSRMLTFPLSGSNEGRDALLLAGEGLIQIVDPNHEIIEQIMLPVAEIPSIARSYERDPSGRYRIWLGFPSVQKVYTLYVR